ncbi:MAG TPA: PP2C family protein-serine/threonine phosphatase [Holophaga sp.]|nr:PP2C family protein-serine/threonine phosphatase [Holophaga sp.]
MPAPPPASPFDRLRELSLRTPEGAQELLPIVDFLESFPEQLTEEALIHLVGVTALGIAKASQGGLWDGTRWLFLRGSATPFPTHPGPGWACLPWCHGDTRYGYLVVRAAGTPAALRLLLSISAPLLAWRRLETVRSDQNRALALQFSRLNALFQLSRNLGEAERKEDIVALACRKIMAEFHFDRILAVDPQGLVMFSHGLGEIPPVLEGEALNEVASEQGLVHALEMRDQDQGHGFAYTCEPAVGTLDEEDDQFLHTLVNMAAARISGFELREAKAQSQRIEKDLELARNIQRMILPKRLPEPAGWECAAANLPYERVGGDLYDLWTASDLNGVSRLHLAVADVSGKGLPASLMMTQLSAFLRAMADHRVKDWGQLASRLNARMDEVRDHNRYATLFMGSINPADGSMRYVNAGHNPPLLVPADGGPVVRLHPTGPMVGLLPGAAFQEGRARMLPGDVLIIFTDGVVDAEDVHGRELGEEPLIEVARTCGSASSEEVFERLLVRTLQHMDGCGFKDDVTLMVIKRRGGGRPAGE